MDKIAQVRCDGWTADRRAHFVAAIAAGVRVVAAAAQAGPSASSAYRLYRRDAGFRAAWDQAIAARQPQPALAPARIDAATLGTRSLTRRMLRFQRMTASIDAATRASAS